MQQKVLLVEDEEAFIDALTVGLSAEGFHVEVARDGQEALEKFAIVKPDIILLDLMLPKISGVDVCKKIRKTSSVPIVMVSAKTTEVDMVVGLEVGADDYVSKPYSIRELVARMRAVMRRSNPVDRDLAEDSKGSLVFNGISIDVERHLVSVRGENISLPLKEFELLAVLMANSGIVLTRDTLLDRVWGFDYVGDSKTLDVHIKRLRSKVEIDPSNPDLIVTVRGVGYKFSA